MGGLGIWTAASTAGQTFPWHTERNVAVGEGGIVTETAVSEAEYPGSVIGVPWAIDVSKDPVVDDWPCPGNVVGTPWATEYPEEAAPDLPPELLALLSKRRLDA